jgi:hypothetical protein
MKSPESTGLQSPGTPVKIGSGLQLLGTSESFHDWWGLLGKKVAGFRRMRSEI